MITITISETEYEIDHTVLTANSIQSGMVELRAPKTGFRKWKNGNYIVLNFFVWLIKYDNPKDAYETLVSYVGNTCNLSIDNTNYQLTYQDNLPIDFFILSCEPFYYQGTNNYEVCNFRLLAQTRTEEQYLYLIDDLENYIITDDGRKIRIDL